MYVVLCESVYIEKITDRKIDVNSTKFMSLKVYYTYGSLSALLDKFCYIWLLDTNDCYKILVKNKEQHAFMDTRQR